MSTINVSIAHDNDTSIAQLCHIEVFADPNSKTAVAFGVYGVPETFVIGRNGVVAYKQVGPIPYARLSDEVTRLLGSPAT